MLPLAPVHELGSTHLQHPPATPRQGGFGAPRRIWRAKAYLARQSVFGALTALRGERGGWDGEGGSEERWAVSQGRGEKNSGAAGGGARWVELPVMHTDRWTQEETQTHTRHSHHQRL